MCGHVEEPTSTGHPTRCAMARRRVELGPRPPPCVHRGYGRCRRGDRRAERGMTPATTPRPTPNSAAGVTPGRSTCPGLRPSEETFPSHTSGATSRRAELGVDPKDVRQLRQVTYPGGQTEAFTYGAAGNRLSRRAGATTTSCSYDDAGQLVSDGTNTYGTALRPPPPPWPPSEGMPGHDGETRRTLHPPPDADP
jgi:hypothetical protein